MTFWKEKFTSENSFGDFLFWNELQKRTYTNDHLPGICDLVKIYSAIEASIDFYRLLELEQTERDEMNLYPLYIGCHGERLR